MVRVLVQQLEEVTDSKLLAYNAHMESNCREMFDLLTSTVLAPTSICLLSCIFFVFCSASPHLSYSPSVSVPLIYAS